jgi:quercetin dioxygenase-like cupin family protein
VVKKSALFLALVLGLAGGSRALAQDAVVVAADHYKVKVANAHVRVVECILKAGEKDSQHTHPAGWYYVTMGGKMKVTHADGKTEIWEPPTGESNWMEAEGPHTSENVGTSTMSFILVEVKGAAGKAPGKK